MITKMERLKQLHLQQYLLEEQGVYREGTYVRIEATLEKRFSMLLTAERLVTLCSLEG